MAIEERLTLLEDTLAEWQNAIGNDYAGYRNHVYRMVHFCLALRNCTGEERQKIIIAGCFHDIGLWSDHTVDYLPPSVALAKDYLWRRQLEPWSPEIELMIDSHHKLRKYRDDRYPLVEVFRRADLIDVSLGLVRCGLPRAHVACVKQQFPNAGFHKGLVQRLAGWVPRHPLRPLPFLKW